MQDVRMGGHTFLLPNSVTGDFIRRELVGRMHRKIVEYMGEILQ